MVSRVASMIELDDVSPAGVIWLGWKLANDRLEAIVVFQRCAFAIAGATGVACGANLILHFLPGFKASALVAVSIGCLAASRWLHGRAIETVKTLRQFEAKYRAEAGL